MPPELFERYVAYIQNLCVLGTFLNVQPGEITFGTVEIKDPMKLYLRVGQRSFVLEWRLFDVRWRSTKSDPYDDSHQPGMDAVLAFEETCGRPFHEEMDLDFLIG